ncbi:MAG: ThiF family adenylyltransferase [Thermoplasmata archaeon]
MVVVGLGAVGAVAAERLVQRGAREIVLVDRDLVDRRNLERTSFYEKEDIGDPKAIAAQARLRALDPEARVEAWVRDVHAGTVLPLVGDSDVVVDGTDNLRTRFLLNEACIQYRIPFLYGGAAGALGMASPLHPPETPCFRCLLLPAQLERPTIPCMTGLAPVAARVGDLLASHALGFLRTGTTTPGLYVLRDGEPDVQRVRISPRVGCPACQRSPPEFLRPHNGPTVVQLCGGDTVSVDPGREEDVSLERLAARLTRVARVRLTPYLLSLEVPPYGLSIFPDGRALVRGARSPEVAQALYRRYVGL